ncbi:MAG TPA: hypothetical protein VFW96_18920 [Thermomicrobiales bacterium]|nr:hypothetical protein [Thermomicrobiales bacterium]
MSAARYIFDLEMPPVFLGETLAVARAQPDTQLAYEETLTWDAGAAVGLIRIETGTLAVLDDLYAWWRRKRRAVAFPFDMTVRVGNRVRLSFNQHPPEALRELVAQHQEAMVARLTEG